MSFNTELTRAGVLEQVLAERESQDLKWGDQTLNSDEHWTVILTEELGEVAREVYETCISKLFNVQRFVLLGRKLLLTALNNCLGEFEWKKIQKKLLKNYLSIRS